MPLVVRTIRDRILSHPALDALASLSFAIERDMHVAMLHGATYADLKDPLAERHGTSIKHVEMVRDVLQGRLDSLVEGAKLNVATLKNKLVAKRKDVTRRRAQVTKARKAIIREEAKPRPDDGVIVAHRAAMRTAKASLHQHARRIGTLEAKLFKAEARVARPVLCFGSRDLLRRRAALDLPQAVGPDGSTLDEAGRIEAIAVCRREWDRRRGGEILLAGATMARDGNRFVRLESDDAGWNIVLRLPQALRHLADRTFTSGGVEVREAAVGRVCFPHGRGDFAAALMRGGAPITWRFQRDASHDGSWQVRCTFRDEVPEVRDTTFAHGALGLDFNADHLALSLIDGRGCFVRCWRIPLDVAGLSSSATLDACRKAAKRVAEIASNHHAPVVAERLDFAKKKAEIRSVDGAIRTRALHALAYATFASTLDSACARQGVRLSRVNPAYTSIIGFACYAKPNGIGIHHAAACAIARRGQDFSERLPSEIRISLVGAAHVTLSRPERIARRHVWATWAVVAKERKANIRSFLRERAVRSSGCAAGPDRPTGSVVSKPPPALASRTSAGPPKGVIGSPVPTGLSG